MLSRRAFLRATLTTAATAAYDHAPHGRLGTVGILGNHDYGPGWAHPEIAEQVGKELARRGVQVLRNEGREVEPPLLPVANRRYTAGTFDVGGGRRLSINRGVGHLIPVRFNVRPKVTVFDLRRA